MDVAGSGTAVDVAKFVWEQGRDREATLCMKKRRLPMDEGGRRG